MVQRFEEVTEYNKRQKKPFEYNGRNAASITTMMRILVRMERHNNGNSDIVNILTNLDAYLSFINLIVIFI